MTSTGSLEDKIEIRELYEKYCEGVNQRDAEIWGSTWAKDAIWSLPVVPGMEEVKGREAIVAAWVEAMTYFPFVFMSNSFGVMRFEGNRAFIRSYTSEVAETKDGHTIRPRGQYDDIVVKIGNEWLFEKRIFHPIHGE